MSATPRRFDALFTFLILTLLVLASASTSPASAATIHVNAASPCPGAGTPGSPYCKIQNAICHAVAGDLVSVAPGTYAESIRMRPGVSVLSTGGYTVTTINGTGKPCIQGGSTPPDPVKDYCLALSGSTQCSTVVFGTGFVNADRLDGFSIRGGKGIVRNTEFQIAGGGIFSLSSPTISNNLIAGNVLAGPHDYFMGGGVYLNSPTSATPILTRNTIDGNRAVPTSGYSYGVGGGIYVGIGAHPAITSNLITNNVAGDVSVSATTGIGGGISIYASGGPPTTINANLIVGNTAQEDGAGIYVGNYDLTRSHPIVAITNNEIRANRAGRRGGGVSTYYASVTIVNNTIVANIALNAGGIYVSRGTPTDGVVISNNLISSNSATDTLLGGGGLYVSTLVPRTPLAVRNNDFWANTPAGKQVGGALNDAGTIGVNGNLQVNPSFANAPANDYHPLVGSPVIDKGNNADAVSIPFDAEGRARIQDGDLDCTAIVDMGEYELPEADSDGDGTPNCSDPCPLDVVNDSDNDGVCTGNAFRPPKTGKNDNCPTVANANQANGDGDPLGDACDSCPLDAQNDQDNDGICAGNAFNPPKTGKNDNCPTVANTSQTNGDTDALGDACDSCPGDAQNDQDGDGVCAGLGFGPPKTGDHDNCPTTSNPSQTNIDGDPLGDACDPDIDNDGFANASDCAPTVVTVHSAPAVLGDSLKWSNGTTLVWDHAAQGNTYDVYRGSIAPTGMAGVFNHACFEEDSADRSTVDPQKPLPGRGFYYVVSSRNRCGESSLGATTGGGNIPNGSPCALVIRDSDGDGVADVDDNCAAVANSGQQDGDGDGVGDVCDNCPTVSNVTQSNGDGDALGDACEVCPTAAPEADADGDGVLDACDNCPAVSNASQANFDGDALGDACDPCRGDALNDQDSDGICAGFGFASPKTGDRDNCPTVANASQTDTDTDGRGNSCDSCPGDPLNDHDGDGICAGIGFSAPKTADRDNCPDIQNVDQADSDQDGIGNVCDSCPGDALNDQDADGICAGTGFDVPKTGDHDNCPTAANTSQADADHDGPGDACDICQNDALNDGDGDGYCAGSGFRAPKIGDQDNCPALANANQANSDGDLHGNVCDNCPSVANNDQSNADGDTFGDACDPCTNDPLNDGDGDGYCAGTGFLPPRLGDNDNCPVLSNPTQTNSDGDGRGDACDNCPLATNPDQANSDGDTYGDPCDNCRFVTNQDQADNDGDGVGNVCDFDTDNDGVDDPLDCAPANGTVYAAPIEVAGVGLRYAPTTEISWDSQTAGSGSGTTYDIATGLVATLRTPARYGPGTCLSANVAGPPWIDSLPPPDTGAAFYYLVRAQNVCGGGTYGSPAANMHGSTGTPCP